MDNKRNEKKISFPEAETIHLALPTSSLASWEFSVRRGGVNVGKPSLPETSRDLPFKLLFLQPWAAKKACASQLPENPWQLWNSK